MKPALEIMAGASQERSQNTARVARRLLAELGPFRRQLFYAFILILITAAAQTSAPWLIGRAIDREILNGDGAGLSRSMLLLLVVYAGGTLASRAQIYQIGAVGQRVLASLRRRLFDQFHHLPLRFFDRQQTGDLMSRVINDVDTINQLLSQGLTQLLGSLFSLFSILIVMLLLNPRLALASFTIIPLMLLTTFSLAGRARKAFRTTRKTTGEIAAGLQEEIVGVRESQAFNRAQINIARFRKRNAANRTANVQATGITSAFAPAIDVLSTVGMAIVIGYGGYLVFNGELSVGLLAAFLIYVQQLFRPIQLISMVYAQVQSSLAGGERIYAILDEERDQEDARDAVVLQEVAGRIEFDGVHFAYQPGNDVLHDINFSIEAGQTAAIVGRTGAGKTTIAGLIPRLYDVTAGAVRIDGHDVRGVKRASLREQTAMVLQESFLFSGTVADNIAYGREGATRAEIELAAQAVCADTFIAGLPQGYDTQLGEAGVMISQGQRQLLSFARAILANPRILILDEATSNIDTRTETLIQQALAILLHGRTSIVIAHRFSTIRDADQILVVEDGRIIERGTHQALLKKNGVFADIYRRQFQDLVSRPAVAVDSQVE